MPEKALILLVADDEPMLLHALTRVLARAGHTVHGAADADQALAVLRGHRVDGAVVDHNMPGGGGSVLQALIGRPDFDGPAILMTGDDVDDPALPRLPGVLRLQKPFRYDELLKLLGRGPA